MTAEHIKRKKNSDIEALRALSIILVIFAHVAGILSPDSILWTIMEKFRFGFGVDIFFCISGYIITSSIANEISKRRNLQEAASFAIPFWVRRVWRLMPSALFWLSISALLSAIFGGQGAFLKISDYASSLAAAAFQYLNVIYPTQRDLGLLGDAGVFWSLSLENQFYFLLPLTIVIVGKRWLPAFFALVFISQFFLERQLTHPTPVMWAFRTDAISLGVLLALWQGTLSYRRLEPKFFHNPLFAIAVIATSVVLLAKLTSPLPPLPFAMGFTAIGASILVWIASYNSNYFTSSDFLSGITNYIGSRSYSIYLTHVISLSLVHQLYFQKIGETGPTVFDRAHTLLYITTFIILTTLFSEFGYRFIERPCRNKGARFSKKLKLHLTQ